MSHEVVRKLVLSNCIIVPKPDGRPLKWFFLRFGDSWEYVSIGLADFGDGIDRVDFDFEVTDAASASKVTEGDEANRWLRLDLEERSTSVSCKASMITAGELFFDIESISFCDKFGRELISMAVKYDEYSLPQVFVTHQ